MGVEGFKSKTLFPLLFFFPLVLSLLFIPAAQVYHWWGVAEGAERKRKP
jgi:hypothetical protein